MILLVAIAVGVIAALLLFNYVKGIENRAYDNAKRVDVFIASGQIKRGAPGQQSVDAGDIKQTQIPQQFRPDTAINTTDEIGPKVALFDIAPGTVIVQGMFVDPKTSQISFRQRLKNQKFVAVSVANSTGPEGVAGLLVPTDEINLMVFEDLQQATSTSGGAGGQGGQGGQAGGGNQAPGSSKALIMKTKAHLLYQKVPILAVGQTPQLAPGEQTDPKQQQAAQNSSTLTFEVPVEASMWIASAQRGAGGFYFTLAGTEYVPSVVTLPDTFEALPGELPDQLTPYGPQGQQK